MEINHLSPELKELINEYPTLIDMMKPYAEKDNTELFMIWNIITDYDDAFNTGEPYPYSDDLYNKLNNLPSIKQAP